MSYQVIARKWRPKAFADLVGQPHISQTLLNALKNKRLPHALLFTGPRGTGKTSSARILAKSVRCPHATDFIPCGECSDCIEIAAGTHLDVVEIDGASNNGVDAIRELRDTVGYMPSSGSYKVYIIDEVHMLSTSAFNALLKTLEEPPEHVIFVLATTEVHKIPNTILSRCQRFDFRRIPTRQIAERLKSICQSEGVKANEEALWVVARQGDGSMRDSQSLLDQVITFCSGDVTQEKVVEVLGLTSRSLLLNTLEGLITRNHQKVVEVVRDIFTAGYDPKVYVQDLLEELRHLLLIKLSPAQASEMVDLPQTEIDHLKSLGDSLGQEDIHFLFDMALKGANEIPRAQDPRIVLEMLLFRMVAAPRIAQLSQLGEVSASLASVASPPEPNVLASSPSVASAKKNISPAPPQEMKEIPAAAPPMEPSVTASKQEAVQVSTDDVSQENGDTNSPIKDEPVAGLTLSGNPAKDWLALVERIKKVNGLVAAKLEHSYLIQVSPEKEILLGIPPKMKFLYEQVRDNHFQKKICNYITTFWGPGYSLAVQLGDEKKSQVLTPKAIAQKEEEKKNEDITQKIQNHALVKQAQTMFKSEIQSIKEIP
ncbi:MAG: DNA polymerase III subunit gamma/tau [Bdellovibrionales bacterium]|nr:DNA polymerase III subunit gamma/tau [Bdellovibrionales bacterium]